MKRESKFKTALSAIGLAGMFAFTVQSARADLFSFDLSAGNSDISGYSGPYAQVVVDRTSSTMATITFTSLTAGGNIYLFGGGDSGAVAVNVNATSWTLGSTISESNAGTGFTPGPGSNGGAGNEDGFGTFNQTINNFDGYTHSADTISFTLTDTSGTWTDASSVLAANSDGNLAAAHIFVTSLPANAANGALATGFASGGPTVPSVPDGGSTAALLGLAMLGISSVRRAFGRK